ncbi:hypothetical protein EMIHUDRAFT_207692 [Emiliania huxleyi CCMP1516]|uniref:UBR-type domain-containing protein n=2 Tax=Emiliania huxleyi TaxID=2903 RepID=A0A0D3JDU6_EMIH1|nr:hypothetical protein EMIHUDRAFT_207692 [Emiliania huxleyi CCMP1516]EOD21681.1 hypothetical protein EMIHUDRAFT_207692 [Emiliania huxleyi CCMP1516]|eukprot:XP_005774110.1 hypothetical protein EMIHUDRAFT_207692 [Emiliania huxleyi CCMP1516]
MKDGDDDDLALAIALSKSLMVASPIEYGDPTHGAGGDEASYPPPAYSAFAGQEALQAARALLRRLALGLVVTLVQAAAAALLLPPAGAGRSPPGGGESDSDEGGDGRDASPLAALPLMAAPLLEMARLCVRAIEVRGRVAEGLLGEPTSGRRRLAAACTRLLAPLDLRSLVLSGAAPPGGGSACELLRLLSALLCTFCLSANLPTGSAGSHTLGSAVGRRLSAVLCRGLLPAALRLIRREAAAIKAGRRAWAALRACQPQPADPRAVALLLRCTSRLLVDVDSEHDQAAAARLESVPVRLAGGFNLAAEAPCSDEPPQPAGSVGAQLSLQLSLLSFLGGPVLGREAPAALAPLVRRSLGTRHAVVRTGAIDPAVPPGGQLAPPAVLAAAAADDSGRDEAALLRSLLAHLLAVDAAAVGGGFDGDGASASGAAWMDVGRGAGGRGASESWRLSAAASAMASEVLRARTQLAMDAVLRACAAAAACASGGGEGLVLQCGALGRQLLGLCLDGWQAHCAPRLTAAATALLPAAAARAAWADVIRTGRLHAAVSTALDAAMPPAASASHSAAVLGLALDKLEGLLASNDTAAHALLCYLLCAAPAGGHLDERALSATLALLRHDERLGRDRAAGWPLAPRTEPLVLRLTLSLVSLREGELETGASPPASGDAAAAASGSSGGGAWQRLSQLLGALLLAPAEGESPHALAQAALQARLWPALRRHLEKCCASTTQGTPFRGDGTTPPQPCLWSAWGADLFALMRGLAVAGGGALALSASDAEAMEMVCAPVTAGGAVVLARGSVDESNADLALPDEASAVERRARQLACRVCTYAVTGSNFTDQHWYYCYTCGLTQSEGCCSVCIRVCHAGHVVSLALLRCMAESSFVTVVFGAYEWLLSLAQAEERAAAAVGIAASEPDLFPTALGFEIVSLAFCPADSTLLLVAGLRAAAVLTVSPRGEVSVRLPLDLGLETPTASSPPPSLLRALWAPGVAPCVGLLSGGPAGWVKLYDLRRHRGAPFAHLAPPDEPLKDVTFATDAAAGPEAASPGLVVLAMSGAASVAAAAGAPCGGSGGAGSATLQPLLLCVTPAAIEATKPPGGGGSQLDSLRAALLRAFERRTSATRLAFRVDAFEEGSCVTSSPEVTLFVDAARGAPDSIKARLSAASDDCIVGQVEYGPMTLSVSNSSSDLVPIGVRLLLGASHPHQVPSSIRLFGRTVSTVDGERRWYDLPFTPAESIVGQRSFSLTLAPAHSGAGPPVLNAVEVFGATRREFGFDMQVTALSAKHLTPSAASSVHGGEGGLRRRQILVGLETALTELRALPRALRLDGSLATLRRPAKSLLRLLEPQRERYHEIKDGALFRHTAAVAEALAAEPSSAGAAAAMSAAVGGADRAALGSASAAAAALLPLLSALCKVVHKRPQSLLRHHAVEEPPPAAEEGGGRAAEPSGGPAPAPPTAAELDALRPIWSQLSALLLSQSESVRTATAAALSRALLSSLPSGAAPPFDGFAGMGGAMGSAKSVEFLVANSCLGGSAPLYAAQSAVLPLLANESEGDGGGNEGNEGGDGEGSPPPPMAPMGLAAAEGGEPSLDSAPSAMEMDTALGGGSLGRPEVAGGARRRQRHLVCCLRLLMLEGLEGLSNTSGITALPYLQLLVQFAGTEPPAALHAPSAATVLPEGAAVAAPAGKPAGASAEVQEAIGWGVAVADAVSARLMSAGGAEQAASPSAAKPAYGRMHASDLFEEAAQLLLDAAKKLLLALCGSKPRYAELRDAGLASIELARVRRVLSEARVLDASPPHEGAAPDGQRIGGDAAGGVDAGGGGIWIATLPFLLRATFALRGESSLLHPLLAAAQLARFVRLFALCGRACIRAEACAVVAGLWAHATREQRCSIYASLRAVLPALPQQGAASHELIVLLGNLLLPAAASAAASGAVTDAGLPPHMASHVMDSFVAALRAQHQLLSAHPNAGTYAALGSLVEVDGHYLETAPAHASARPEAAPTQVKLESLQAETKFTENCQIVRLSASHTLHGGVLRIADVRRSMMVASIRLYAHNKPVADAGELKGRWDLWRRVKTLPVAAGQAEVRFDFSVPVVATNLLIEYATFHEPAVGASEKLQCPRCSRSVADRHGICRHCGDNAYQCRHCRNINYEHLDAFLCNECGFCKHSRFEWLLQVRPSYVVERITTEAEKKRLVGMCLSLFCRLAGEDAAMRDALLARGLLEEVFANCLINAPRRCVGPATRLLCTLSLGSEAATTALQRRLSARLQLCLLHHSALPQEELLAPEVTLLCDLASMHDDLWPQRLAMLLGALRSGIRLVSAPPPSSDAAQRPSTSFLCRRLVLPCLRVLLATIAPPAPVVPPMPSGAASPTLTELAGAGGSGALIAPAFMRRAVAAGGLASAEYFELLRGLAAPASRRLFLVARGTLPHLVALVDEEARAVRAVEEADGVLDLLQGRTLRALVELLASLVEPPTSDSERRRFLAACVAAVREHRLCGLVCPERPEPDYPLQLSKAPTQEEFIRGAMTKNPYMKSSLGPLMRDVKNRICRDLDMVGLIEDDNGMELLVAGKIVKLDLPVAAVYEQGLDGEATEEIVEAIDEEAAEETDPEAEFALSAVVGEEGGLELLLRLLEVAGMPRAGQPGECIVLLLKLLHACCRIRANRRRVLALGGTARLLRLYAHFELYADFGACDAAGDAAGRHAFWLECLVGLLTEPQSRVAAEAGLARAGAAYLLSAFAAERQGATAAQWAEALSRPALPFVLQLLGSLARTHAGTQQLLLAPEVMGTIHALEQHSSSASKAIGTWAEALLEAMRDAGLAATVDRLRQSTQASKRKAALDQRQRILSSMGMSAAAGDGKGPGSKRVVVSAAATAALIGDLQEEVGHVCVVCGEGEAYRPGETLGVYVFTKRVPLPSLCEPCGGAASAAHASPVSRGSPFLPYGSALGSLGLGGAVAPSEACHTTVSHFNTIHVRCHREAATAERSLKQPKQEWEGATLRNSRTRANGLLPFWGATVGEEAYGACVEQFWAQAQSTGRADAPRPKLLAHNLRLLLLRFACEEQFSHDARGGGRESNIRLLPYLVQMASYFLDAKGEAQRRSHRRSLAAFRLRQHDQAVLSELASLLADYEAELLTMADLDEAFDVLGLTALALEAGSVSEFVARAKSAG